MSQEWYDLFKTVHILATIVWLGGAVFAQIQGTRLMRAGDVERAGRFAKDIEWFGMRVFMPASIVVLLMGIVMVWLYDHIAFTDLWILLGLAGIASTIVIGSVFLGPEAGRLGRLVGEKEPTDPEVIARQRRIFLISRIDLAVLLLVVVVMVYKPGA